MDGGPVLSPAMSSRRKLFPSNLQEEYDIMNDTSGPPERKSARKNKSPYISEQLSLEKESLYAPSNIMFDRRVVRGNTHTTRIFTQGERLATEGFRSEQEKRMKAEAQRRKTEAQGRIQPRTPPPIAGRNHVEIQTDTYLEELFDRPLEYDTHTQTDSILDRPSSPLFVRAKTGMDIETQVEVGELFDFDLEVEPILEVLIGKALEYSMIEMLEEEELEMLHRRQQKYNAIRNAELAEVQRLEAEALRSHQEKQRRLKQTKENLIALKQLEAKVAACSFARTYLSSLNDEVFVSLEYTEQFCNPVRREIEESFVPWLLDSSIAFYNKQKVAHYLVDELLTASNEKFIRIQQDADNEIYTCMEKIRFQKEAKLAAIAAAKDAKLTAAAEAEAALKATENDKNLDDIVENLDENED